MAIKICPNGHHYNTDDNPTCPYCEKVESRSSRIGWLGPDVSPWEPNTDPPAPPFIPPQEQIDDEKTRFVVGWLVCTAGSDRGRSFRLVRGNNTIGRPENESRYGINLTDQAISRKGAAGMIVYNEKHRSFFIVPGDLTANINIYLNDEILLSPQKLNSRAVIEIAGDTLIFVPFCGERFAWKKEDDRPNLAEPEKNKEDDQPDHAEPENNKEDDQPNRAEPEKRGIVRCQNGHYYNRDTYDSCPYCGENLPDHAKTGEKGIVRCQNGHYYNGDIYDSCPYCRKSKQNDPDGMTLIFS